jgi:hypothetical protein
VVKWSEEVAETNAKWQIWASTVFFSAVAGLSVWYGITHAGRAGLAVYQPPATENVSEAATPTSGGAVVGGFAMEYAHAVQDNNCDAIIRMVWWMRERLDEVRAEAGDAAVIEAEQSRLCGTLSARAIEDMQLRAEGVADRYVFTPSSTLELVEVDAGQSDLARPTSGRTWIRVTYPNRSQALRDERGQAIRSIEVGVNETVDGYVLKAGVDGNLDISYDTISYFPLSK